MKTTGPVDPKIVKRRQKNKLASAKCRERKIRRAQLLQQEVSEMRTVVEEKQRKLGSIQDEISQYKMFLDRFQHTLTDDEKKKYQELFMKETEDEIQSSMTQQGSSRRQEERMSSETDDEDMEDEEDIDEDYQPQIEIMGRPKLEESDDPKVNERRAKDRAKQDRKTMKDKEKIDNLKQKIKNVDKTIEGHVAQIQIFVNKGRKLYQGNKNCRQVPSNEDFIMDELNQIETTALQLKNEIDNFNGQKDTNKSSMVEEPESFNFNFNGYPAQIKDNTNISHNHNGAAVYNYNGVTSQDDYSLYGGQDNYSTNDDCVVPNFA